MDIKDILGKKAIKAENQYDYRGEYKDLINDNEIWNKKLFHEFYMTVHSNAREAFLLRNAVTNAWKIFPFIGIKRDFNDGVFLGPETIEEKIIFEIMNNKNDPIWKLRNILRESNYKLVEYFDKHSDKKEKFNNFYSNNLDNSSFLQLCDNIKKDIDVYLYNIDFKRFQIFCTSLYNIFDIKVINYYDFCVLSNYNEIKKMFKILINFYHKKGDIYITDENAANYAENLIIKKRLNFLSESFFCNKKYRSIIDV